MKIAAVSNQYYTNNSGYRRKPSLTVEQPPVSERKPVHFYGWFGKKDSKPVETKKNDFGMTGEDYTISFKVADVLNRLGDDAILVIGNSNNLFLKNRVKRAITEDKKQLPNAKDLKDVYLINNKRDEYIISKKDKDTFLIYGGANNLSNPERYTIDYPVYQTAKYGDIIKTKDGLKIKFMKLPETKTIMYDAKYPVEAFLTKGNTIDGGVVINKAERERSNIDNEEGINESKSKWARPIPKRTFDDVAGLDDTIDIIKKKILFPMLYPNAFRENKNQGAILYGPPGVGKTLLALALIGEARDRKGQKIHFIKVNSNDLGSQYANITEHRWREIFDELLDNQPSLLFIDEADNVLTKRQEGHNHVTNNQVTTEFLTQIDNIEKTDANVWILAATNNPDMIDPAIKRSGRLGDMIEFKKPDEKGCLDILNLYLKKKKVDKDFNREKFAKNIHSLGYTGADIAEIVSDAKDEMYTRCGIWEKMDNGTYKDWDLDGLEYSAKDFENALKNQKIRKQRPQIGFDKK